ncbi:MAG TPA: DUF882 domain-containing protein [Candidatus Eisenbacteria bacterium]|nr:DUF882 domain-containing protein [Candidatus Eisenbacteria bacterium]
MSYLVENNIQLSKNFKLSEFACKHCGKVKIDMELVYVLQKMRDKVGRINIPIAYRCPEFNAQVVKNDSKANPNSYHIYGKAADIHVDHPYNEALRDIAEECGATGVGLYDTFIHVDVGAKRRWDYRTKKFKHYRSNGADVIEVDPLALAHVWLQGNDRKLPTELVKKYPNFVNCMFYDFGTAGLFRLLIQDGQVLSEIKSYDKWSDKGTFIVYSNGDVVVDTIGRDIFSKFYVPRIKLAFQGFNLDYEKNGSTNLKDSMRKEGWGQSDDYIYSSNCLRPAFGYNYKTGKAIIAVKKTNAKGLRSLMRSLGCKTVNNDTCAIGGDSGGSIALAVDGKILHNGNRSQVSILTW